jgi:hypothetical protein
MLVFAIIIFGLATLRTFTAFLTAPMYESGWTFLGRVIIAATMVIAYIWFLTESISVSAK